MDNGLQNLSADIKISVCVITFNQEKYILKCLKGIKAQTDSPQFEVIIRDDASTDQTGLLIRSYIEENQLANFFYHKADTNGGMVKNLTSALSLCRGEIIAFCEGDDYWMDSGKLRKQYALLKTNPGCFICAHACYIDGVDGLSVKPAFYRGDELKRFELRDILFGSSSQYAPTASYMIRKEVVEDLPEWFHDAPITDFFVELLCLKHGYGLYMPDAMCAYRVFAGGSWSSGMRNDRRRSIDYGHKMLKIISILESDEQLRINGLEVLKANVLALLASDFLLSGEFVTFKQFIEDSFSLNRRWQSKTARYLYLFRRLPHLAAFLYRTKRSYFE